MSFTVVIGSNGLIGFPLQPNYFPTRRTFQWDAISSPLEPPLDEIKCSHQSEHQRLPVKIWLSFPPIRKFDKCSDIQMICIKRGSDHMLSSFGWDVKPLVTYCKEKGSAPVFQNSPQVVRLASSVFKSIHIWHKVWTCERTDGLVKWQANWSCRLITVKVKGKTF